MPEEIVFRKYTIRELATLIDLDWEKKDYQSLPHLNGMYKVDTLEDEIGLDDGYTAVLYFLVNAKGWKGAN